ncbi:Txe/YoeB family addiction module toxin [Fusobacterium animalis]|uniref:Putative mRNA interferase YoeB n=1 Tax=Fusobacterium animalis TaxID=76859 RepID=A0A2B7YRM8_9FUSO|nr:Txe/YoeB family addiction module toxin [Fusobacterium animalis]PGH24306.1 Txe/YoeB family addiction module toxin [Fusobacterium animalis]
MIIKTDEFIWHEKALNEYTDWLVKKKNKQINDLKINGVLKGIGKPEQLKHCRKPTFSRRIDEEHRLVYDIKDNHIRILSCEGHYNDKNFDEY